MEIVSCPKEFVCTSLKCNVKMHENGKKKSKHESKQTNEQQIKSNPTITFSVVNISFLPLFAGGFYFVLARQNIQSSIIVNNNKNNRKITRMKLKSRCSQTKPTKSRFILFLFFFRICNHLTHKQPETAHHTHTRTESNSFTHSHKVNTFSLTTLIKRFVENNV